MQHFDLRLTHWLVHPVLGQTAVSQRRFKILRIHHLDYLLRTHVPSHYRICHSLPIITLITRRREFVDVNFNNFETKLLRPRGSMVAPMSQGTVLDNKSNQSGFQPCGSFLKSLETFQGRKAIAKSRTLPFRSCFNQILYSKYEQRFPSYKKFQVPRLLRF